MTGKGTEESERGAQTGMFALVIEEKMEVTVEKRFKKDDIFPLGFLFSLE